MDPSGPASIAESAASAGARDGAGHLRDRLRAMLFVGLANLVLACWIGTSYLADLPDDVAPRLWWFAHAGLLSSILTLVLLPGACLALAALSRLTDRAFLVLQTLTWSFFHLTLLIDTRVFGL